MPEGITSATISIDPEQWDIAERELGELTEHLDDAHMVETWGAVSDGLAEYYESWPPKSARNLNLQPQTTDRHPEETPLDLDDALKRTLTQKAPGNHAVRRITPGSLHWGTNLYYAGFVNYGTENMAPRNFMDLTEELQAAVTGILDERVGMDGLFHLTL